MTEQKIYNNCEIYTAFPETDEILASDLEKDLLLPIGVYHLKTQNEVHDILLAAPIGDEEGMIGKDNFGERCGETWLTYFKKDGKWALDCSYDDLLSFNCNSNDAKHSYKIKKESFSKKGFIPYTSSPSEKLIIFNASSKAYSGLNWFVDIRSHIPHKLVDIGESKKGVIILDSKNNEYSYLGYVESSTYSRPLLPQLHFFYNPSEKRVLVIHEFS